MARFIRIGKTQFLVTPAVANLNDVLRSEITSALALTPEVADASGWALENNRAATPDFSSSFEKSIPGTDAAADSSFTLYEDDLTEETESTLRKGEKLDVIILRKGDIPGSESMDVYRTVVSSKAPEYNAGNEPARYIVTFAITEEPALDQEIPAAA